MPAESAMNVLELRLDDRVGHSATIYQYKQPRLLPMRQERSRTRLYVTNPHPAVAAASPSVRRPAWPHS